MSATHYDESTEFDPGPPVDVEELGQDPLLPVPQLDVLILDGEYGCAVLSLAGDPLAPNLAQQVKVRTILAIDVPSLQPQVISCLIADYGLDQEQAELLWDTAKPGMPAGREPVPLLTEGEWHSEPGPVAQPGMQAYPDEPRREA